MYILKYKDYRVILVVEMERNEGRGGSVVVLSGFFHGFEWDESGRVMSFTWVGGLGGSG